MIDKRYWIYFQPLNMIMVGFTHFLYGIGFLNHGCEGE